MLHSVHQTAIQCYILCTKLLFRALKLNSDTWELTFEASEFSSWLSELVGSQSDWLSVRCQCQAYVSAGGWGGETQSHETLPQNL